MKPVTCEKRGEDLLECSGIYWRPGRPQNQTPGGFFSIIPNSHWELNGPIYIQGQNQASRYHCGISVKWGLSLSKAESVFKTIYQRRAFQYAPHAHVQTGLVDHWVTVKQLLEELPPESLAQSGAQPFPTCAHATVKDRLACEGHLRGCQLLAPKQGLRRTCRERQLQPKQSQRKSRCRENTWKNFWLTVNHVSHSVLCKTSNLNIYLYLKMPKSF